MRTIKFRAWTGKRMIYQDKQYLASFIRRIVPEINLDHGKEYLPHESYLPNGGIIDEYLQQFTGVLDKNEKDIYEGDRVRGEHGEGWIIYDASSGAYRVQMYTGWHKLDACELEIIGHIYESESRP